MGNLSSIRRKLEKLERRQELLDRAPGFDPYEQIQSQALGYLSDEELKILVRMRNGLYQGRSLDQLSTEELAAFVAAGSSWEAALQKECERFGITVAQFAERRGLAKPLVMQLKQMYIEKHRSEISFRNRSKRKIAKLF